MKKWSILFFCLMALCLTITVRAGDGKSIPMNQLPATAQQFVRQHFSIDQLALVKMESELFSKSYEVVFSNGDHIEFDSKGNWEKIDCHSSVVPAELVPAPIAKYVRKHYPMASILELEKGRKEYEVKLSNRRELTFDTNFNLTDID